MLPAIVSALILVAIAIKPDLLDGISFYFLFAMVITLSVELVGVYLVFSTLILPALALNKYLGKAKLALAYGVGVIGYIFGLALSASYDLPSGAAIVATLALSAFMFRLTISRINQSNTGATR